MAVLPILTYPNQLLKEKAKRVNEINNGIKKIAKDLKDTMFASPGSVGVAAPQVGILKRIICIDVSKHKKANSNHGLLILINPEILAKGGGVIVREGCMSVPDYTANIKRASWVLLDAVDLKGKQIIIESIGFEAVVLQHEIDHLNGILFLDRIASLTTDLFRRKNYK